jgi:hypothetical protein
VKRTKKKVDLCVGVGEQLAGVSNLLLHERDHDTQIFLCKHFNFPMRHPCSCISLVAVPEQWKVEEATMLRQLLVEDYRNFHFILPCITSDMSSKALSAREPMADCMVMDQFVMMMES